MATGQGNVAYLEVQAGTLKQVGHHKLDTEVACLDITPVGQAPFITPPPRSPVCTTGLQHYQEGFHSLLLTGEIVRAALTNSSFW